MSWEMFIVMTKMNKKTHILILLRWGLRTGVDSNFIDVASTKDYPF